MHSIVNNRHKGERMRLVSDKRLIEAAAAVTTSAYAENTDLGEKIVDLGQALSEYQSARNTDAAAALLYLLDRRIAKGVIDDEEIIEARNAVPIEDLYL